ncbi:MAG TPA: SH3 domain-containing protein [bacterium]|nr:SH3 domain-containing protein [bacterium]
MKRLTLGTLVLLLSWQGAFAATLTIIRSWTAVRARPTVSAPTLTLVFGNDTLTYVRRSGTWLAVRLPDGRVGWIVAQAAALPPTQSAPAPSPASATKTATPVHADASGGSAGQTLAPGGT